MGLDYILERGDFVVPMLGNASGLFSHGGHIGEGRGPSGEVIFEGFNFPFVFGDFRLEDTSTNTVASGDTNWTSQDRSGAATINLGSHVFFPRVEFPGFTVGGVNKTLSCGFHVSTDINQALGKCVEFISSVFAVLIGGFQGVVKDFDGGFIDHEISTLEHFSSRFEGDS